MKFTMFNYSSPEFLQSIYFKAEIDKLNSCSMSLINGLDNVYAVYDEIQPDYSIVNIGDNLDLLKHYNHNTENPIKHIINLDYLSDRHMPSVIDIVADASLNCVLLFSTNTKHKNVNFKVPYIHIPNAADINIPKSLKSFDIDNCVVIKKETDKRPYAKTYHFLAVGNNQVGADIVTNNIGASRVFNNYRSVVFRNITSNVISETFFNALYFGNFVFFDNDDNSEDDTINNVLNKMLDTNISFNYKDNQEYDVSQVRAKIQSKHTSKNRLKTLLSQIKNTYNILMEMGE